MAAAREGVQVGIEGNSARDAGQDKVAAAGGVTVFFQKRRDVFGDAVCLYCNFGETNGMMRE